MSAMDRSKFGLPKNKLGIVPNHITNKDTPAVPPLSAPPEYAKVEETEAENLVRAWRAYDVTLIASKGDRVLADKAFQAVRREHSGAKDISTSGDEGK